MVATNEQPAKIALDEIEAAKVLGIGKTLLQELRTKPDGPPHVKLGARIVYPVRALEDWVNRRAVAGGTK